MENGAKVMTSCRNFITAWMKCTARMSSIWWCWFQRAPDFSNVFSWVFVLITQLRISAGGPNSVLLTTELPVCKGWRVSYRQAKESLCGFLNFIACADEKPVLPTHPVGCKCQWELRHQWLLMLCNTFPKSLPKILQEQCWWFPFPPKAQDSPPEGAANLLWSPARGVQEGAVQWAFHCG